VLVFFPREALIADLRENSGDKYAAARMFFFVSLGRAAHAPICIAGISFCKYLSCNRHRNRRGAQRMKLRAAE
jgi:hypothetical protein